MNTQSIPTHLLPAIAEGLRQGVNALAANQHSDEYRQADADLQEFQRSTNQDGTATGLPTGLQPSPLRRAKVPRTPAARRERSTRISWAGRKAHVLHVLRAKLQPDVFTEIDTQEFARLNGLAYLELKNALPELESEGWISRKNAGKRGSQYIVLFTVRGPQKLLSECKLKGQVMHVARKVILDAVPLGNYAKVDFGALAIAHTDVSSSTFANTLIALIHEGTVQRAFNAQEKTHYYMQVELKAA